MIFIFDPEANSGMGIGNQLHLAIASVYGCDNVTFVTNPIWFFNQVDRLTKDDKVVFVNYFLLEEWEGSIKNTKIVFAQDLEAVDLWGEDSKEIYDSLLLYGIDSESGGISTPQTKKQAQEYISILGELPESRRGAFLVLAD
ncbi:MAG: hypothetical protein R3B41_04175 [Candidatus Doudnabacteria bacterium]